MKNIIAILPSFIKGIGICSQIYYEDELVDDPRTCSHFLKNLCDKKCISKKMMRKNVKKLTDIKRNLPWVIDQNNVFFSVKYQESEHADMRRAYINCNYVKEIKDSEIILITDEKISTLQTKDSLNENLILANYLMYKLRYENLKDLIIDNGIIIKSAFLKNAF